MTSTTTYVIAGVSVAGVVGLGLSIQYYRWYQILIARGKPAQSPNEFWDWLRGKVVYSVNGVNY